MQPVKFKAPFIEKSSIWDLADKLRNRFPAFSSPPVEVLKLAEIGLKLDFDLQPLQGLETVALLMRDLKTIVIDKFAFTCPYLETRLRFSVAHELGHLILHPQIYGKLSFKSPEQWKSFIAGLPAVEYGKVEWQAYEFAGRLLVPLEALTAMNKEALDLAKMEGYWQADETRSSAFGFIAKTISREFKVSQDVIERRLTSEGLWEKN